MSMENGFNNEAIKNFVGGETAKEKNEQQKKREGEIKEFVEKMLARADGLELDRDQAVDALRQINQKIREFNDTFQIQVDPDAAFMGVPVTEFDIVVDGKDYTFSLNKIVQSQRLDWYTTPADLYFGIKHTIKKKT